MTDRVVRSAGAPGCVSGRLPAREARLLPQDDRRRCYVCRRAYRGPHWAYRCERWHWGDSGGR
jgi:hypothetical protein